MILTRMESQSTQLRTFTCVKVLSNLRMISFRKVLILGSFLHLCSLLLNIEQRQILFQSSFLHLSHCWDLQVTWLISCRFNLSILRFFPLLLDCPSCPTGYRATVNQSSTLGSPLRWVWGAKDQPKMREGQFEVVWWVEVKVVCGCWKVMVVAHSDSSPIPSTLSLETLHARTGFRLLQEPPFWICRRKLGSQYFHSIGQ